MWANAWTRSTGGIRAGEGALELRIPCQLGWLILATSLCSAQAGMERCRTTGRDNAGLEMERKAPGSKRRAVVTG